MSALLVVMDTIFSIWSVFRVDLLARFAQEKINVQLVQDLTITMEEYANCALNPVHNVKVHNFVQVVPPQVMRYRREAV